MRQDAVFDQAVVAAVQNCRVEVREGSFKLLEQLHPRVAGELEPVGGLGGRGAQGARRQRQGVGIERGGAGQHAKALAKQLQTQTVARLDAAGDGVEHEFVADPVLLQQAQGQDLGRIGFLLLVAARALQAGQRGFDMVEESADEDRRAAPEAAHGGNPGLLQHGVAARRGAGEREFGFMQDARQQLFHRGPQVGQQMFQRLTHAPGEAGGRQRG